MRRTFEKKVVGHVGNIFVNEKRLARLLQYLKYRHNPDFESFFLDNGKLKVNATSFHESESFQTFIASLIDRFLDDTLWFYEGTYLFNRCLRLLSVRPRSRKEIRDFLKLHADNARSMTLIEERLEPFLNDKDFAEFLVQKERSHNPKGDTLIRRKLQEKGIDSAIIDDALHEDIDTFALIQKQYDKKRDSLYSRIQRKGSVNIEREFNQKMKQFLFSKGFSLQDIDRFMTNTRQDVYEDESPSPDI